MAGPGLIIMDNGVTYRLWINSLNCKISDGGTQVMMIVCEFHGLQQDDHAQSCKAKRRGKIQKLAAYIVKH